jgi:hypothetical protein
VRFKCNLRHYTLDYVEPVYEKPAAKAAKTEGNGGGGGGAGGASGSGGGGSGGSGGNGKGKEPEEPVDDTPKFLAFAGGGNRLDSKKSRWGCTS